MLNNRRQKHNKMTSRGMRRTKEEYIYIFFLQILQILQCFHAVIAYSKYDLILTKVIIGNSGYYKAITEINCCLHGTVLLEIWSWLGSYLNDV